MNLKGRFSQRIQGLHTVSGPTSVTVLAYPVLRSEVRLPLPPGNQLTIRPYSVTKHHNRHPLGHSSPTLQGAQHQRLSRALRKARSPRLHEQVLCFARLTQQRLLGPWIQKTSNVLLVIRYPMLGPTDQNYLTSSTSSPPPCNTMKTCLPEAGYLQP
jgi:hypothetical protein